MTGGANAKQKKRANNLFDLFCFALVLDLWELVHLTSETKISKNSGLLKKCNYQKALRRSSLDCTVRFL
jgi:hypothetical protein